MIADIAHRGKRYRIALSDPIDISLPLDAEASGPRAWSVGAPSFEAVRYGDQEMTVAAGASVDFRDLHFNPHGHGTHTETVAHIVPERIPVGRILQRYFHTARLITVEPELHKMPDGSTDRVITQAQLQTALTTATPEALVLRTLPNGNEKRTRNWSNSNPPYLQAEACQWLRTIGVRHLLVDLPSVDREQDGGALAAHKAFWDAENALDTLRTITELIHVPDEVADGAYILELQVPHIINDAAPSRPVLYAVL